MRQNLFERIVEARDALHAAEEAHPDSPALAALHERANGLLARFGHLFTDDQYQTLSGGGPNKPPLPDDTGGG